VQTKERTDRRSGRAAENIMPTPTLSDDEGIKTISTEYSVTVREGNVVLRDADSLRLEGFLKQLSFEPVYSEGVIKSYGEIARVMNRQKNISTTI